MTMRHTPVILALVLVAAASARGAVEVGGESVEVVDMHLHPGSWGVQSASGKEFLTRALPPAFKLHAPALFQVLQDPYFPHLGIRDQAVWGQVDRVVLYAAYVQRTVGYMSNEAVDALLADPRNDNGWAVGFASINLENFTDEEVRAQRVAALASWFEHRGDRFVGIKLAHAHQAVALDDEIMLPVYDVAADYGVPLLLHTGFSPFPGSQGEPRYYDPMWLEAIVSAYDGGQGRPRVDFILSHVGTGDLRSVAAALDLAERHDNVWLEISALGSAARIDSNGSPTSGGPPQYQAVLAGAAERGLLDRTLFGSDGPAPSGKIVGYVGAILAEMQNQAFTLEQIRGVMAANFDRLFQLDSPD